MTVKCTQCNYTGTPDFGPKKVSETPYGIAIFLFFIGGFFFAPIWFAIPILFLMALGAWIKRARSSGPMICSQCGSPYVVVQGMDDKIVI